MKRTPFHAKVMVVSLAFGLLGFAASAYADDTGNSTSNGGGSGWVKGACKDDIQKLCPDAKGPQVRDCLKNNDANLSQDCKDNMAKMKAKMEEKMADMKKACQADLDQYCKDIKPGEGREIACLHAHNDKISSTCKDYMKSMHKEHRQMMMKHKDMMSGQGGTSQNNGGTTNDNSGSTEAPAAQ